MYNLSNKLKTLSNKKSAAVLSQYTYTYYLDGNQAVKSETGNKTTEYVYNGPGRLASEIAKVNGTATITRLYSYDDSNNR